MKRVYIGWRGPTLTRLSTEVITLSTSSLLLVVGAGSKLIKLTTKLEDVPVWESSDTSVVTVDQNGNATPVGEGVATITVYVGKHKKSVRVTVRPTDENQLQKDLDNGKATLPKDLTTTVQITTNTVLNLNNKTLTGNVFAESNGQMTEGITDSYAIWVKEGGNITVNGNGVVESQAAKYSIAVWAQGGTVVINDGEYRNNGEGSDLIYASAGGKVYIYGGEFYANEKQPGVPGTANTHTALNIKDSDRSTSEIIVYGGTFYNFNPADNLSEGPNTNFVADGYESIEVSPNVWEVRKKTPEDPVIPEDPKLDSTKIYLGIIDPTYTNSIGPNGYKAINSEMLLNSYNNGFITEVSQGEHTYEIPQDFSSFIVIIPKNSSLICKVNNLGQEDDFVDVIGSGCAANGGLIVDGHKLYGQMFDYMANAEITIIIK